MDLFAQWFKELVSLNMLVEDVNVKCNIYIYESQLAVSVPFSGK